jgi:hypothetical protein
MKGVLIVCAFLVAASYGGDTDEKTDATVVESCTNTMSSLLRAKHAAIMGLETISSGQGDAKLAMDEADDAQIAAAENEAEKNVNEFYGKDGKDLGETLQSASKADVKSWKARVGGMTRKLAALQKRYAHAAPTALDSAFELGESNPANKLPTPVVAPGKDHHKEIIFQCMANVMKANSSKTIPRQLCFLKGRRIAMRPTLVL